MSLFFIFQKYQAVAAGVLEACEKASREKPSAAIQVSSSTDAPEDPSDGCFYPLDCSQHECIHPTPTLPIEIEYEGQRYKVSEMLQRRRDMDMIEKAVEFFYHYVEDVFSDHLPRLLRSRTRSPTSVFRASVPPASVLYGVLSSLLLFVITLDICPIF